MNIQAHRTSHIAQLIDSKSVSLILKHLKTIVFSLFVTFSLNGYSQVLVANSNGDSNGDSKLFNEMLTAQIPILDLNSKSFSISSFQPNEIINSTKYTLALIPYNGCGGGCISTNGRCCGTCSSIDKGTQVGCPSEYSCVRVQGVNGVNRFECWHYGPDWGSTTIGNAFGVDIPNAPMTNCSFFKIFKQINTNPLTLLSDNITYNDDYTVAGWDSTIESGYTTLKYYFEFYTSAGSLICTIIFNE